MDMEALKLGEALWTMHLDHMRLLEEIVERSGTRGESGVLLYLYHTGRPMFPGELTEKLGLTTGRIANILRSLERSELVVRTPDGLDKRRVLVALTPAGEEAAERRNAEAIAYHARLIGPLDEARAQALLDTLSFLADTEARRTETRES